MMQMCGRVSSNSGGNEGDVDAASIRPPNETCPTEAACEGGGRGRHRDALEHALSKADNSPQPARMTGEARADRLRRSVPRPARGTLAIVFHPSFGGVAGPAGSESPVIVCCPSSRGKGHDRPETGSGPFVSGVGARLDRCLPWERNSRPARRSQGATASRARSKGRWWSRARRGDGEVGRHRGASSQRPLMPMPRSDHRPLRKIRRSQRDDPALPGVRVTLAAAKVTLVGTGVTLERTWIGPRVTFGRRCTSRRVTFGRRCTSRRVTFDRHLALLRMTFRVTSFRIMNGAGARCPGFE